MPLLVIQEVWDGAFEVLGTDLLEDVHPIKSQGSADLIISGRPMLTLILCE